MGYEGQDFSDIAAGVSPAFIEALYAKYQADSSSVDAGWRSFFDGLEQGVGAPSWQNKRWPLTSTDDLTAGLDPTQMEPAPKPAKGGKPAPAAAAAAAPRPPISSRRRATRSARRC
ncbi:Uncharacterised protein [Sphingomonas paucimobilis]|nr:Uncharacterised protein [Sphingomonas paucimobilis]